MILQFFTNQQSLEYLKIATTTGIPIQLLEEIIKKLPKLKTFFIKITEILLNVDQYLEKLLKFPQLRGIRLEQNGMYENLTHQPFNFSELPQSNVRSFRLVYFPKCSIPNIHTFAKSMKGLQRLSLKAATIENFELDVIFEHLTQLVDLDLSYCQGISNAGFTGVEKGKNKVTRVGKFTLKELKGLRFLNIIGSSRLTLEAFLEDFELLDLRVIGITLPENKSLVDNPNFKRIEKLYLPKPLYSKDLNIVSFSSTAYSRMPRLRRIIQVSSGVLGTRLA